MNEKIVDIKGARRKKVLREFAAIRDPGNVLEIPMEDVIQGMDSANDSLEDPIRVGPRADLALRRMMGHFGIEHYPTTMGELQGLRYYCQFLLIKARKGAGSAADEALWEKIVDEGVAEDYPNALEPVRALRVGDSERLRALHRVSITPASLVQYYEGLSPKPEY